MEEAVTRSVATMSLAFIINSTPWIIKQIIVACLGNDVIPSTIDSIDLTNSFFFKVQYVHSVFKIKFQSILIDERDLKNCFSALASSFEIQVAPWLDFLITWSSLSLGVWNPLLCWLLCPPIRDGVRHILSVACACCYSNNYSQPTSM